LKTLLVWSSIRVGAGSIIGETETPEDGESGIVGVEYISAVVVTASGVTDVQPDENSTTTNRIKVHNRIFLKSSSLKLARVDVEINHWLPQNLSTQ
jgi:hypothetical protein